MRYAELPERTVAPHLKVIAGAQVPLERWRMREQRTDLAKRVDYVDRLSGRGIGEREGLYHFAAVPRCTARYGEAFSDPSDKRDLDTADAVVRSVGGEGQVARDARIEDRDLGVLPVFLINRAVELEAAVQPLGLPACLVVGERIGRVCERWREYPVNGRTRCDDRGRAVEAARAESLRPGVIDQRLVGDVPGKVRAAPETLVSGVEVLGIEVVQVADHTGLHRAHTGVRRRDAVVGAEYLAAEAADIRAHLEILRLVPARAAGDGQLLRDQVEVDRGEQRGLLVAARDVVEEAVAELAHVRVVCRCRQGRGRRGVRVDGRRTHRGEIRAGAVVPVNVLVD